MLELISINWTVDQHAGLSLCVWCDFIGSSTQLQFASPYNVVVWARWRGLLLQVSPKRLHARFCRIRPPYLYDITEYTEQNNTEFAYSWDVFLLICVMHWWEHLREKKGKKAHSFTTDSPQTSDHFVNYNKRLRESFFHTLSKTSVSGEVCPLSGYFSSHIFQSLTRHKVFISVTFED